jgi:hypothetical protein
MALLSSCPCRPRWHTPTTPTCPCTHSHTHHQPRSPMATLSWRPCASSTTSSRTTHQTTTRHRLATRVQSRRSSTPQLPATTHAGHLTPTCSQAALRPRRDTLPRHLQSLPQHQTLASSIWPWPQQQQQQQAQVQQQQQQQQQQLATRPPRSHLRSRQCGSRSSCRGWLSPQRQVHGPTWVSFWPSK